MTACTTSTIAALMPMMPVFDVLQQTIVRANFLMHSVGQLHTTCIITDCGFREIRLAGWGNSSSQGRVEVCNYNVWGSVCDDTWDVLDAQVACYQLGYSTIGI